MRYDARSVAVLTGLVACLLWSFWSTVVELFQFWQRNDDYSVGMLVAPVALWLVWRKRTQLLGGEARPAWIGGLVAILIAQFIRFTGLYYGSGSLERYSLVFSVAAIVLLVWGYKRSWRLRWVLVFLLLAVPLPRRVHEAVALPLQGFATGVAQFTLETIGFFVARTGNVLELDDQTVVAVAEACSGLRMLTAFVFITAVVAFLTRRARWQRVVLVMFSIPLAIGSNAIRVVATAIVIYYAGSSGLADSFHDWAGLAMMPLALAFSFGLLRLLDQLVAPDPPQSKRGGQAHAPRPARAKSTPSDSSDPGLPPQTPARLGRLP